MDQTFDQAVFIMCENTLKTKFLFLMQHSCEECDSILAVPSVCSSHVGITTKLASTIMSGSSGN